MALFCGAGGLHAELRGILHLLEVVAEVSQLLVLPAQLCVELLELNLELRLAVHLVVLHDQLEVADEGLPEQKDATAAGLGQVDRERAKLLLDETEDGGGRHPLPLFPHLDDVCEDEMLDVADGREAIGLAQDARCDSLVARFRGELAQVRSNAIHDFQVSDVLPGCKEVGGELLDEERLLGEEGLLEAVDRVVVAVAAFFWQQLFDRAHQQLHHAFGRLLHRGEQPVDERLEVDRVVVTAEDGRLEAVVVQIAFV
mmetsp:Transcript_18483/g.39171  ORF Transcript_18483/g.39171 Transcript_18483/m.39171 type:complete len:256 (-) Transcript_18483:1142-1909(-)